MTMYRVIHKLEMFSKKCKVYKKSEDLNACIKYANYLETYVGGPQFLTIQSYNVNRCPSWLDVDGWRYDVLR